MSIRQQATIEDIRPEKEFSGITFSGYKSVAVKNQLLKSLVAGEIEAAQYWAAELLCAGHLMMIWEVCFLISARYIHRANARLASYLSMKLLKFRRLARAGEFSADLEMRNDVDIRQIFAEMICIIALSPKQHSLDNVVIKEGDFDGEKMALRCRAPNTTYADRIFRHGEKRGTGAASASASSSTTTHASTPTSTVLATDITRATGDPPEIYVAVNEFMYSISDEGLNLQLACFWAEWICDLDAQSRKRKLSLNIMPRTNAPVEDKYMDDPVWILWEGIFDTIERKKIHREKELLRKLAHDLLTIYTLRYTPSIKKRRRFLLYMLINYVVEIPAFDRPIVYQTHTVGAICSKISAVYQQLKQYEVRTLGSRAVEGEESSNAPQPIPSFLPQPTAVLTALPPKPHLPSL